jgi:hypothetical protein
LGEVLVDLRFVDIFAADGFGVEGLLEGFAEVGVGKGVLLFGGAHNAQRGVVGANSPEINKDP